MSEETATIETRTDSELTDELPWYCFLYRVLGAGGTFWLWLVTLIGLWLLVDDAWIAALNRRPAPRSVAHAASGQELGRTWVQLRGLEIRDARKVLGLPPQSGSPLRLLLDASDPAAERWLNLRKLSDRLGDHPKASSEAGREFEQLKALFARERESYLPTRPILLFEDGAVAPVSSSTALSMPLAGEQRISADLLAQAEREFQTAVKLIREEIKPEVEVVGLLDETPPSQLRRVGQELALGLSGKTLRLSREPRRGPALGFALWLLVFIFLLAGLSPVLRRDGPREPLKPASD